MMNPGTMMPLSPGRTPLDSTAASQWLNACAVVALVVLLGVIAASPRNLVYDEIFHMQGARMLAEGSGLRAMLLAPLESAPGPLYPVVHALLRPLTDLSAPAIRYVNFAFLLVTIAAMAYCLRRWGVTDPWPRAAMILAVPKVWSTTGVALTEVPALAMVSLALAAGVRAAQARDHAVLHRYAGFAVAGFLVGLAILGRQTYLPVVLAFAAVALRKPALRGPALAGLLIALAVPAPVFYTWGGLTPRSQAHLGGAISIEHGVLAFSYLAAAVLFLAPGYLMSRWRIVVAAAVIAAVANVALFGIEVVPMQGAVRRLPQVVAERAGLIVGSLMVGCAAAFVAASAINVWDRRRDELFVLCITLAAVLTATAFGIVYLFSARYILAAFPFILLAVQPFFTPSKWAAARLAAGSALGALSLVSYFG